MAEPDEFDCVECNRHIVRFGKDFDSMGLCAACLMVPGWYRNPRLRAVMDPEMVPPEEEED